MRTICIFSGRFQPAHRGHLSVYQHLVERFGAGNVFIATSDAQAPLTSPFSFSDKVEMWTLLGVPASHVVRVRSPYNPVEITSEVPDPDNTALVMAVSEKDMQGDAARFRFGTKKDGGPSYLQPWSAGEKNLAPLTQHAYILTVPVTTFKIMGSDANSATQIRQAYLAADAEQRKKIISALYGDADPAIQRTFDSRLSVTERTADLLQEAERQASRRSQRLIERVQHLEQQAEGSAFTEELIQNYRRER